MKENAPKDMVSDAAHPVVPLAIGVVTVAALAVVVGMVWKDYRTAMMDSQTRQMELVVQSTADSIRVLLEEYADRLDSIAGKAEGSKAFRPTVARAIPSGTSGWKTAAARSSTAAMASAPSAMSSSPGRRTSPTGSTTAVTSTIL